MSYFSLITPCFSRYSQIDDEFEQFGRSLTGFEGEPSFDSSQEFTFPDNFSDVNSEDMRRPVPDSFNNSEVEVKTSTIQVQRSMNLPCALLLKAFTMSHLDTVMQPT